MDTWDSVSYATFVRRSRSRVKVWPHRCPQRRAARTGRGGPALGLMKLVIVILSGRISSLLIGYPPIFNLVLFVNLDHIF